MTAREARVHIAGVGRHVQKLGDVEELHARIAVMRGFGLSQRAIAKKLGCDTKSVWKWVNENQEFMDRFTSFVATLVDSVRAEVTETENVLKDEYIKKQEEFLGEMHRIKRELLKSDDDRVRLAVIMQNENRIYGMAKNVTRHEGGMTHNVVYMPGPMPSIAKGNERRALKMGHVPAVKVEDDGDAAIPE